MKSLLLAYLLTQSLPLGTAARFDKGEIKTAELDEYLAKKYARKEEGESALQHQLQLRIIQKEMQKRGISIPKDQIEKRISDLEKGLSASKADSTLESELKAKQIAFDDFVELLRISLAHEKMAREDLGVSSGETLTAAQLNLWITEKVQKANLVRDPAKLSPKDVLLVEETPITWLEVGGTLRTMLGRKATRTALVEMIGIRTLEAKAKEVGIEIRDSDVDAEIARRRENVAKDERFKGISYEEILKAQGMTIEDLKKDVRVRGSLILGKIAEKIYNREALEASYQRDPSKYDNLYGESRKISWILIRAVKFPNQFIKRTFEDAEKEAKSIREQLKGPEDFARVAKLYSEDDRNKASGGELGFVHRAEPNFEPAVLEAVFKAEPNTVLDPIQLAQGIVIVLVQEKRNAPAHDEVLAKIRDEMRSEFYTNLLKEAKIETFVDEDLK